MHAHRPPLTTCRDGRPTPAVAHARPPRDAAVALHGHLGNAALLRLLQARLNVSQPDDPYEQEAERVAGAVTRTPAPMAGPASPSPMPDRAPVQVRRACPTCAPELERQALQEEEEEELLQAKALAPADRIQRQAPLEEDEAPLSAKAAAGNLAREALPEEEPLARRAAGIDADGAVSNEVETALAGLAGRGQPLPGPVRADLEPRFGADFSAVRVHTDAGAHELARTVHAEAFTLGTDVVFGAGRFAPETDIGRHLLAHELTHVVQQRPGATLQRQSGPAASDADDWTSINIKIPPGVATRMDLLRYAEVQMFGRVVNFVWQGNQPAADDPARHIGKSVTFRVGKSTLVALRGPAAPGGAAAKAEQQEAAKTYKTLDPAEKDAIDAEIDQRYYASTEQAPGTKIAKGETGKAVVWNSLRDQVLADRKRLATLPTAVKGIIGGDPSPADYQVLVQVGKALATLSDQELAGFFKAGPNGVAITPADYPQLLSIARKLANLSSEARADYLARVNAKTTSLAEMEVSVDRYLAFRAERERQDQEHEEAAKPLLGADDVYGLYRGYLALKSNLALASALKGAARDKAAAAESVDYLKDRLRDTETRLLAALKDKGFDSIDAFAAAVEAYRVAFRTQAVNLALDVLARYDHMLFQQRENLAQPGAAAGIVKGIAGTQAAADYQEYRTQKATARNLQMAHEPKETWHIAPMRAAEGAAASAKAKADAGVIQGSGNNALVAGRGVDLEKLAGLDEAGMQSYLAELIADRTESVRSARAEFRTDPDRIFSQPELVAATYKVLGAEPSTLYGRIISDYISDEARKHLFSNIALGILAIALAFLVPGGGWLAAAALVGQAGISGYQAYSAYQEYQSQQRDWELGFLSEEPSLFWVGVAIAAAALDLGVASTVLLKQSATALKALKGPMLEFAKDGELAKLVAKIDVAEGLDAKFKAAMVREATAAKQADAAWQAFHASAGRLNGFLPGTSLLDPDIIRPFFRGLYYSIKRGANTLVKLSADRKFLELTGDLTGLTGAQRGQLEAAFEEVKQLVKVGQAKGMDDSALLGFVDRWALNRGKPGFQAKLADDMRLWKPLTDEQRRALDAVSGQKRTVAGLYERKEVVEEELAALRAQPDRTAEDVAEIRDLEKELRALDPDALPTRSSPPGKKPPSQPQGKIAEAEQRLGLLETEAAKSQLSLYDRLRAAAPSEAAKAGALKSAQVDQVGALKTKPTGLHADHIVSVREISDLDGFADLPWIDQKKIVDMRDNLIAMDGAANASKGDRTWRSWTQASSFYEPSTIAAMVKREGEVRTLIQKEIQKRLEDLRAARP